MANTIRIKRSTTTNSPVSLAQGELAYSEDDSPNGEGELFIGTAGSTITKITTTVLTGTDGVAAQPNSSAQDNQTITTGTGLDGADAGSSGDITLSVDLSELPDMVAAVNGAEDEMILLDNGAQHRKLLSEIDLSAFNNDSGWTTNTGDITRVNITAGTGMTGTQDTTTGDHTQTLALDYVGVDNFIDSATDLEGTAISSGDTIIYHDASDDTIKKGLVSDLPSSGGEANQTITTGLGLDGADAGSSGDITIDLALTELTNVTAAGADWIAIEDATDNSTKKTLISGVDVGLFDNATTEYVSENDTLVVADWNWVLDEDAMGSNSDTHVPTQQSVKAYVDSAVTGALTHKGGYNAATNTPPLDTGSPTLAIGDMYTVTAAGTFFTEALEVGDVLISDVDSTDAAQLSDWTIVQKNIDQATETTPGWVEIATTGEVAAATDDTVAITPAKLSSITTLGTIDTGTWEGDVISTTYLQNTSGTNTGDEPDASETVKGIIEIATQAEVDSGSSALLAVTPQYLHLTTFDGGTF